MKKGMKVALATTVALGTFAVADLAPNSDSHTQAAETEYVKPWYDYNGYAGYDANFVTEQVFINALKENNITINNTQLDLSNQGSDFYDTEPTVKEIYDQEYKFYDSVHASYVGFEVKNDLLTFDNVRAAYDNYPRTFDEETNAYTYDVNGQYISFTVDDNLVTKVELGYPGQ